MCIRDRYVTEEELLDGVKQTDLSKPDRNTLPVGDEIVKTRAYRERAAAIAVEADRATFNNCSFLSKQDTLFTGNGREYYNNCIIEGTCDYIFGNGIAVFDNCELRWAASPLSTDSDGGYICAPQSSSNLGYLFYNCKVTGNENAIAGDFGRPWGDENSQATFYNTTICKNSKGKPLITDRGWTNMSSTADKAKFYEYGSIDENGNAVDTSKRVVNTIQPIGTVLDEWQILEFSPYNYLKGGDNWDPTGKNSMFESVEAGGKALNLNSANGVKYNEITGYYEVTDNFILPSTSVDFQTNWAIFGSDGKPGSIWASIDGNNLKVVKPAFGQDTEKVTLALYIRNEDSNGVGAKVTFTLDIQTSEPASGEAAEALKQVIEGLNADMESNYGDGNGGYIANAAMNLYTVNSAFNGASYIWQSNNENVITPTGIVNRPNFTDNDAVVTLTCTVSIAGAADVVTYVVIVPRMKFGNWETFESAEIGDTAAKSIQWLPSESTDQSKITVGIVDNIENKKQENNGKIYKYYHEAAPGGSANSINFYFSGVSGDKSKAVDNTVGEFTYDIYLDKNSDKTEFYFTSATENTSPIINQHTKGSFKGNDGSTGVTFANNMDSDVNGWYTVKYIMDATGDTMVDGKDKHELYYDLYVYDKDDNLISSRLNVLRNTAKSTTSDPCFVSIRPNRSSAYLDFYLDNLGYIDYTEAVAGDKADIEAMLATGMVTELPTKGARDTDITWTVISGDNIIADDGTLTEGIANVKATVKRGYIAGGSHGVTDETAEYTITVGKTQEDILTYKGTQLRYNEGTDNYDIRFVSVIKDNVDISSIEKVGFAFTKNSNTAPNDILTSQRIESTTVYDSISAVGNEVTAESLGGKYISGGIITGVPNTEDAKNTVLYVYAYYVINGEYVYTPVQTVTVNGLL